jgi:hypothetical protein
MRVCQEIWNLVCVGIGLNPETSVAAGVSSVSVAACFVAGAGLIRRRAWGWWTAALFFGSVVAAAVSGVLVAAARGSAGGVVAGLLGAALGGFPLWLLGLSRRRLLARPEPPDRAPTGAGPP